MNFPTDLPQQQQHLISEVVSEAQRLDPSLDVEGLGTSDLYELGFTLEESGPRVFLDAHKRGLIDWDELDTAWRVIELNYETDGPDDPFEFIGPITIEEAEEEAAWLHGVVSSMITTPHPATGRQDKSEQ